MFKISTSNLSIFKSFQNKNINKPKGDRRIYATLGASNQVITDREKDDYYATPPKAVKLLCELEKFHKDILEPCCGEGHISKTLIDLGYNVESSDLINRGYGDRFCSIMDYTGPIKKDIITNPPYEYAADFVRKSLEIVDTDYRVAMFLKLTFLESKSRYWLFNQYPIEKVYVSSTRLGCGKGGVFNRIDPDGEVNEGGAVCYAWFIWTKGFSGKTTLDFFNFN